MICTKRVQGRNSPCSSSLDGYYKIDKIAEMCYYNAVYSLLRGGVECTL